MRIKYSKTEWIYSLSLHLGILIVSLAFSLDESSVFHTPISFFVALILLFIGIYFFVKSMKERRHD